MRSHHHHRRGKPFGFRGCGRIEVALVRLLRQRRQRQRLDPVGVHLVV